MNLLILDGAPDKREGYNPAYRGTYRAHPTYTKSVPDSHEVNLLFRWFLQEGGELGVLHDSERTFRFCKLLNATKTQGLFEVIEATQPTETAHLDGRFLGFDLSSGFNNSLLAAGLRVSPISERLPPSVQEQLHALAGRFGPALNEYGLFPAVELAASCRTSMIALQDTSPNLFEGGDLHEFAPLGIHVVSEFR